ncbi:hypothetical protein [Brachybacterium tyrofermentans]|uniref:hypothetical protein n=1 Tax=Brachybacterium tyrofermentans TaxID=47848 RepID=UPI003FD57986
MSSNYGPRKNRARKVADTFQSATPSPAEEKANTSVWLWTGTRQAARLCALTHNTTFSALIEEGLQLAMKQRPRSTQPTQSGSEGTSEKRVNTSVWLAVDIRQAARVHALEHETTFSALVEEGLQLVLKKYTGK